MKRAALVLLLALPGLDGLCIPLGLLNSRSSGALESAVQPRRAPYILGTVQCSTSMDLTHSAERERHGTKKSASSKRLFSTSLLTAAVLHVGQPAAWAYQTPQGEALAAIHWRAPVENQRPSMPWQLAFTDDDVDEMQEHEDGDGQLSKSAFADKEQDSRIGDVVEAQELAESKEPEIKV